MIRVNYRAPAEIVIHSGRVRDDEICEIGGIACTTAARTAFDLGRRLPLTTAVIRVDALLNATRLPLDKVAALALRYPGARFARRLHDVLALADGGAESPQETRTRLLLVRAGLPRPTTQIPVRVGRIARRIDMGWPQWKVGVEYDGVQHWTDPEKHAGDVDRLEFLAGLGWRIVRVTALHLRRDEPGIVRRATEALRAAGYCI